MKTIRLLLLLIGFGFLFSSCSDENRVFEENFEFEEIGWKRSEPVEFEFEIEDTTRAYNLVYNVRNTLSYRYRNLYLKYALEDSVGNKLTGGLQEVFLFNPKTGRPNGQESSVSGKSLGDIYDHQFLCMQNLRFGQAGKYRFKVFHYMRGKEYLENILAMGLRVEFFVKEEK